MYIHIFKAIFNVSYAYPRNQVWNIGVIIYLLTIGTSFIGYVLPWGQMSYWAATVITNILTVIPIVGYDMLYWIWGDYSVSHHTLTRFMALHYTLPFIILGLVIIHLFLLHQAKSSDPINLLSTNKINLVSFYKFYVWKDLLWLWIVIYLMLQMATKTPYHLASHANYIEANPLKTPKHIEPEWYFWWLYSMLKSMPNKTDGVILMLGAILIWFLLPYFGGYTISSKFRPLYRTLFKLFLFSFFLFNLLWKKTNNWISYLFNSMKYLLLFFFFFIRTISSCYWNNFFISI